MRILGFSVDWPKLDKPEFTTFRFPRKDYDRGRDWHIAEEVQIVVHPRSEFNRVRKGNAQIVSKINMTISQISEPEAREDGFDSLSDMLAWLEKSHGNKPIPPEQPINKLTLRWTMRYDGK